jgi:hypothetical protein
MSLVLGLALHKEPGARYPAASTNSIQMRGIGMFGLPKSLELNDRCDIYVENRNT